VPDWLRYIARIALIAAIAWATLIGFAFIAILAGQHPGG
jgi:hypothetical protein